MLTDKRSHRKEFDGIFCLCGPIFRKTKPEKQITWNLTFIQKLKAETNKQGLCCKNVVFNSILIAVSCIVKYISQQN